MRNDHYSYRVTWSAEDDEYVGLCTEFPSLSWLAHKPEMALNARLAIAESCRYSPAGGSFPDPLSGDTDSARTSAPMLQPQWMQVLIRGTTMHIGGSPSTPTHSPQSLQRSNARTTKRSSAASNSKNAKPPLQGATSNAHTAKASPIMHHCSS